MKGWEKVFEEHEEESEMKGWYQARRPALDVGCDLD